MERKQYKARRRSKRFLEEEIQNREGHWTRSFTFRGEAWPIVEHWASESDYTMVAMRGKRRLYRKGETSSTFVTFLDIKQEESHTTLSAWIEVGFGARLLSGFTLPAELPIEPSGWKGISHRREACSDFNSLLLRLKQPVIIDSNGFHIVDVDATTLLLALSFSVPFLAFSAGAGRGFEMKAGLTNSILQNMGNGAVILFVLALLVVGLHHFVVVNLFRERLFKLISAGAGFLLFSIVAAVLLTKTSSEILRSKVDYYCLYHYEEGLCRRYVDQMPLQERERVAERLFDFQNYLTLKSGEGEAGRGTR